MNRGIIIFLNSSDTTKKGLNEKTTLVVPSALPVPSVPTTTYNYVSVYRRTSTSTHVGII